MTVQVNFRWGHLDRMPKCRHGRVEGFCSCWDDRPPHCRWCGELVIRGLPCTCERAQNEYRRIRGDKR